MAYIKQASHLELFDNYSLANMRFSTLSLLAGAIVAVTGRALVCDSSANVEYQGVERNGIEIFLGIPYGQDTSGQNRFKPPRPYTVPSNTTFDATQPGAACPQPIGQLLPPLALGNVTNISEDCLNLNVARPKGISAGEKLPVIVWIHGGSFWFGSNTEPTTAPDGLVLQSVESGSPIIHVALNYRLARKYPIIFRQVTLTDQKSSLRLRSIRDTERRG